MKPITTTLKAIRKHKPCEDGWKMLLASLGKTKADDASITFSYIAESNGIDDALWCLRALPEEYHPKIRLLAADYAKRVLPLYEKQYPKDKRPRQAIKAAQDFAKGKITQERLNAARDAARDAAWDAARDAAWAARAARDAAWAAGAVGDAAWDAAWAARAARDAAWAAGAVGDAAWDAAWAARDAAWAAAWAAERQIQKELLIKYFG